MKNSNIICPLCDSPDNKPINPAAKNLHRCAGCGVVFNSGFRALDYDDNYFLDDYKRQYGKTYIEDFDNIYRLSAGRLRRIDKLLEVREDKSRLGLLDIGSAAGFFLKAARDAGFGRLTGIEISNFAAGYCGREYGIDVINSSFDNAVIGRPYDVVTAWYFIEHNQNPGEIIRKIYGILNNNGIFAFSVPSIFGPQYLLERDNWILSHPIDHRVDFSPTSVKRCLKKTGFRKVLTYPGGMHPGRVYPPNYAGFGIFSSVYRKISELISFSDTLEVYAVK